MHPIALNDPVIPLGARDGRAEPNLLIRGLLVEDVGTCTRNSNVQDTSLDK